MGHAPGAAGAGRGDNMEDGVMEELHLAWAENEMCENVIEHDNGTLEWRDKIYTTEDALQDALWSCDAMTESFGEAVNNAMNRFEGER